MRSLAGQLIDLGFTRANPPFEKGDGDFAVFDDSDGHGPYIRYWLSDKPCPFPEHIRAPVEHVSTFAKPVEPELALEEAIASRDALRDMADKLDVRIKEIQHAKQTIKDLEEAKGPSNPLLNAITFGLLGK